MTEQTLDALRKQADIIHDEGSRLARSLKGSGANEPTVREHLLNCLKACEAAKAVLDPAKPKPEPVPAPVVAPVVTADPVDPAKITATMHTKPVETPRKPRGR